MDEQPEPEDAACPNCGGEPEDDPRHQLQALGYMHDDIHYHCKDCGKKWTCGVPIGDPDSQDLRCDSCWESSNNEVYGRVNWINWQPDDESFHVTVKCPRCFYVWHVTRDATNEGAMMHDPTIAGSDEDVENPFEQ